MADSKENKTATIDTAQLALRCAQFFMSLGESCLEFYHKYNKEKERKTKMIKKNLKQKAKVVRRADGGEGEQLNEDIKKKLPKKPLTAYIIYFQEKKPNFVQKYPGLNLSDLTKLIAKEWKQIDNNQRKPYLEQAQDDRKRYQTQLREFKQKYGPIAVNPEEPEENGLLENEESSSVIRNEGENNPPQLMIAQKPSEKVEDNENIEEDRGEESGQNENDNEEKMEGEGEGSQNGENDDSEDKQEQD